MIREAMAVLMARWRGLRWSMEDEFGRRSFDGGRVKTEKKSVDDGASLLYRGREARDEAGEREKLKVIVVAHWKTVELANLASVAHWSPCCSLLCSHSPKHCSTP
jgi:hypothetical protein